MNPLIPFCPECGDPRVLVSGAHPGETGVVQWAMYMCGHTRTAIVLESVDVVVQAPVAPLIAEAS
jgi:hypothetical protein